MLHFRLTLLQIFKDSIRKEKGFSVPSTTRRGNNLALEGMVLMRQHSTHQRGDQNRPIREKIPTPSHLLTHKKQNRLTTAKLLKMMFLMLSGRTLDEGEKVPAVGLASIEVVSKELLKL